MIIFLLYMLNYVIYYFIFYFIFYCILKFLNLDCLKKICDFKYKNFIVVRMTGNVVNVVM